MLDGEPVPAGALVEMPAERAAGLAHAVEPARPWLLVRLAWRIRRRLGLARQAIGTALDQRRRRRAWRRRQAGRGAR